MKPTVLGWWETESSSGFRRALVEFPDGRVTVLYNDDLAEQVEAMETDPRYLAASAAVREWYRAA